MNTSNEVKYGDPVWVDGNYEGCYDSAYELENEIIDNTKTQILGGNNHVIL